MREARVETKAASAAVGAVYSVSVRAGNGFELVKNRMP